jgi:hypothetical protein
MCGEPCECPLDDPTAWDHGESLLALHFTHNVDGRAQNALGPVDELAGEAAVGEHEPPRLPDRRFSNRTTVALVSDGLTGAGLTVQRAVPLANPIRLRARHPAEVRALQGASP